MEKEVTNLSPDSPQENVTRENLAGLLADILARYPGSTNFQGDMRLNNRFELPVLTTAPATCNVGELADVAGVLKLCTAANTWTDIGKHKAVVSIITASSYTLNTDLYNALSITALAADINTISSSGTPSNFDTLIIRILDDGTARAITFDPTKFVAKGITLPTATVISKCMTLGFIYDSVVGKWGLVALAQE